MMASSRTSSNRLVLFVAVFLCCVSSVAQAACTDSGDPWQGTLADIKQKITVAEGPSGGSTYVPFADGAGLHIFADNNEVEDEGNSVQAKVAIHEYIHILQQAMLAGDITNLTGTPVPLKASSTSTKRFQAINKCGVPDVFAQKTVAALDAMPDYMKLLDRPVYVILYPHPETGKKCSDTDTKSLEIMKEIYGKDCAAGKWVGRRNGMENENHAFAEGEAEYWGLKITDETKALKVFNGSREWTQKLKDNKGYCGVPGNAKFQIKDGGSPSIDAVINSYKAAGTPQCGDNPIGEITYAHFMDAWCVENKISCTHEKQMQVWLKSACKGWCAAYKEVYGKSWGDFVCHMEKSTGYNTNPSCVATNVPCLSFVASAKCSTAGYVDKAANEDAASSSSGAAAASTGAATTTRLFAALFSVAVTSFIISVLSPPRP